MSQWYKKAKETKQLYKVIVFDNQGAGAQTPPLLKGHTVEAFSPAQAFEKALNIWPKYLILLLKEYAERGMTVKFVQDRLETERQDFIVKQRLEKEKNTWWND